MFIDTHAHLNFKAFRLDYQEAIERARKANVKSIINVGSNYETSLKAIEIAKNFENVFAAVSLHPIHVKDEDFDSEKYLKLLKNKKVVAIGETGLDYYYEKSNKASQKEVFLKLINLSQAVSKPLIVHCREAAADLLPILLAENGNVKGVVHCFQEDWQFAKMIFSLGMFISFTGLITFTKSQKTFEVIKEAPLERIMIETDCPYMTPRPLTPERSDGGRAEPYRGQRNEPAYVVEVARKIAEIKKIPLDVVAEQTTKNARSLFGLAS